MKCVIAAFLVAAVGLGRAEPVEPALTVSLVIPMRDEQRRIYVGTTKRHFHVLLSNRSGKALRVWDPVDLRGRSTISFELRSADGGVREIKRKDNAFAPNQRAYWVIPPQGHLVVDIGFYDRDEWEGVPRAQPEQCDVFVMRAVLEIAADEAAKVESVWTGRVISPPESVGLCQ